MNTSDRYTSMTRSELRDTLLAQWKPPTNISVTGRHYYFGRTAEELRTMLRNYDALVISTREAAKAGLEHTP